MKTNISIALLPGDGIGQEISNESKKIFNWLNNKTNLNIEIIEDLVGGESIDKNDTPLSEKTLEKITKTDAILLGAVGGPKWEKLPFEKDLKEVSLKLEKNLIFLLTLDLQLYLTH